MNNCALSNTLRLAIVAGLWVVGTLLDQWKMDLWTFLIFGWIYLNIIDDCACKEDDDDD